MFSLRKALAVLVVIVAVSAAPGSAWGHGMHYIGTLTATGNGAPAGTVSATTGPGVTGTERLPNGTIVSRSGGCAGSPTSGFYGPFDQGYNERGGVPEPKGCVDVHTTSGSTSTNPVNPQVTISGTGFPENTTFAVTYLLANDKGDLDGDTESQLPTDTNDPFCHRLFYQAKDQFVRAYVTTGPANNQPPGGFNPVTVQLAPYEVGSGQLCINSTTGFQYKGPTTGTNPETGDYMSTSWGQSVGINLIG